MIKREAEERAHVMRPAGRISLSNSSATLSMNWRCRDIARKVKARETSLRNRVCSGGSAVWKFPSTPPRLAERIGIPQDAQHVVEPREHAVTQRRRPTRIVE
jgi:hypothetical protein